MSVDNRKDIAIYGPLNKTETGPSAVCRGMVHGLNKIGNNVTLYTTGNDTHADAETVHIEGSVDSVRDFIKTKTRVAETIRAENHKIFHSLPGLIHGADICTVQGIWADLQMLRWAPHIIQPREFIGANIYSLLKTYGYWRTDTLVAISPLVADQTRTFVRQDITDVIGLGLRDDERVPPDPVGNTINILVPGIVSPIKGQHRILQHLNPDDDRFEIDIVGQVIDKSYVSKFSKWEHRMHGYVDDINEYYEKADIVLLPSEHDNYPTTAVEAIGHGCVVVITDSCGFARFDHVQQSSGVYVVSDGDEMHSVLNSLLSTNLSELKQTAYELSADMTWEEIAWKYDRIYERMDV